MADHPFRAVLLAVALVGAACTGLPDYARPTIDTFEPGTYDPSDVIRYRELSRADFQAKRPPDQVAAHASELGAYTCAIARTSEAETPFAVTPEPGGGFVARVPSVDFHAEMDRQCSWWNPGQSVLPPEYVLQHEQIHFALVEIHARRVERDVLALRGRGDTPEAAAADLQRSIEAATRAARQATLERNSRFDEDTSGRHAPEQQARWLAEVQAELAGSR